MSVSNSGCLVGLLEWTQPTRDIPAVIGHPAKGGRLGVVMIVVMGVGEVMSAVRLG